MTLSLQHVTYIRQGKAILEDINWTVQDGETWAILGLNGSGKSTLMRWNKYFDGTKESLKDKSHRPHRPHRDFLQTQNQQGI